MVSSRVDGFYHAFITGPNGVGMTDLGTLSESSDYNSSSQAYGINDAGQVVGSAETVYHHFTPLSPVPTGWG